MVERQLRWYREQSDVSINTSSNAETVLKYHILIVNEPREISRIETRIYEQLKPIMDESIPITGSIPDTNGLQYKYIQFLSPSSLFFPKKAYDGRIFKDSKLYPRLKDFGLEEYINNTIRK